MNDQVTQDFVLWLKAFYDVFPGLVSKKTYIMGESYAGIYVSPHQALLLQKAHGGAGELLTQATSDSILHPGTPEKQGQTTTSHRIHYYRRRYYRQSCSPV